MAVICYHASHEQFSPSHLLRLVQLAEQAGFGAIHSSDHFHPWSERQGNSGFTFSWIAAALQATTIPYSMICTPGQRLHPAIVAQAIATLGEMFPKRINFELASGEALNECITGDPWPPKDIRNERLLQCSQIIRDLLAGKEVSFEGHVQVKEAKLYTIPPEKPLLLCAALSDETSEWAGSWADGLITTAGPYDDTKRKIDLFKNNGGQGKPVYVQYSFAYGKHKQDAIDGAWHQWRSNLVPAEKLSDMRKPQHFDNETADVTRKQVEENITIITHMSELFEKLSIYQDLDIERISLHNINTNHEFFIEEFGNMM